MNGKLIKQETHYHLVFDKEIVGSTHKIIADKYKLSLKNCQAIERGYDLDELAREITDKEHLLATQYSKGFEKGIVVGFQKALEILGDKKFSEEDVRKSMSRVWYWCKDAQDEDCDELYELENKYIQSLQQTEWDVEIVIEKYGRCEECLKAGMWHCAHADTCGNAIELERPKLDAQGCLILKKI